MGFFKRLFGPRKEQVDAWLAEPREYPSVRVNGTLVKDIPAGDPRWVVSREFADVENPNHRIYLAAARDSDKSWTITRYTFDSKMPSGERLCDTSTIDSVSKPQEVIALMRRFESDAKEKKWLTTKEAKSSVVNFANHFGLHVDANGKIVDVKNQQMGGSDNVFITRGSLDTLFNGKGLSDDKKYMNIDSWETLYAGLVDAVPHAEMTLDALVADPAWTEEFEDSLKSMTKNLQALPAYFLDENVASDRKRAFLERIMNNRPLPDDFSSKEKRAIVTHIVDSAFLVTFLRLASDIYEQQMDAGMTPEGMSALKKSGEVVKQWAQKKFGVDAPAAKRIEGIMTRGQDPYRPGLFTEIILEQVGVAKARVAFAESERKAEEARLALIAREKREAEEKRIAAEKAAKEAEEKRIAEEKAKAEAEAAKAKAAAEATNPAAATTDVKVETNPVAAPAVSEAPVKKRRWGDGFPGLR